MLTREDYRERYNVHMTEQQYEWVREHLRRAAGPPFRMTIDFPPPVLTPDEEEKALADAEYADDMSLEPEEDTYILLSAQTKEGALAEAEEIWRTYRWRWLKWLRIPEPHAEAIGFSVWRADWMSAGLFRDGAYLVGERSGCADGPIKGIASIGAR
jgi:hypothetical protein